MKKLNLKRPIGVTILALVFIWDSIISFGLLSQYFVNADFLSGINETNARLFGQFIVYGSVFLLQVTTGIGLWFLQRWARIGAILLMILSYPRGGRQVASSISAGSPALLELLIGYTIMGLVTGLIVWYLSRKTIKEAFNQR